MRLQEIRNDGETLQSDVLTGHEQNVSGAQETLKTIGLFWFVCFVFLLQTTCRTLENETTNCFSFCSCPLRASVQTLKHSPTKC